MRPVAPGLSRKPLAPGPAGAASPSLLFAPLRLGLRARIWVPAILAPGSACAGTSVPPLADASAGGIAAALAAGALLLAAWVLAGGRAPAKRPPRPARGPRAPGAPLVSIIIPARNEAARIGPTLARVARVAGRLGVAWELIVVDDGSVDGTAELCRSTGPRELRVVGLAESRGKGAAVRRGWREARGEALVFVDADDSAELERLPAMLARLESEADLVAGVRVGGEAGPRRRPATRRGMSLVLNLLSRALLGLDCPDTQCGFKALRRELALAADARMGIDGYAFDLELLYLAQRGGWVRADEPVGWIDAPGSKVRPLRDAASFLRDMARIRFRGWRGDYDEALE